MSERDRLRAKAPELAEFVDALRAEGIDAKVKGITFADGETVGTVRRSTWAQECRAAREQFDRDLIARHTRRVRNAG